MKIASLSEESTIKLVYVVDFSKSKDEVLHAHNKEELELSRKKKLLPFEELLNANNIDFSFELLHGDPGPAIVEHANKKSLIWL